MGCESSLLATYQWLLPLARAFYRPETGPQPPHNRPPRQCGQAIATGADRPERRRSMSTLQHTLQPAFRNRVALMVVLAGALAALTLALVISNSSSSSPAAQAQ